MQALNRDAVLPITAPTLVTANHPARAEVEGFVADVFRRHYGAVVTQFAPVMVARRDGQGSLVAAAGFRPSDQEPLFLERYLARPVDELLGAPRARIAEVGNLAATRAGEGRKLALQLVPLLAELGFQWVVGTLTEELRHLFLQLGIAPTALGLADPALLGEEAVRWGSYFDHQPLVLAAAIEPILRTLTLRGLVA